MARRFAMVLLLLVLPSASRAQEAPEHLLPAGTQIYARWDGIDAHRDAYDKSAFGKMMQGETGKFLVGTVNQLQDSLGAMLTVPQLLGGAAPDQLQKIQALAAEAPKILGVLGKRGVIVAAELRGTEAPEFQVFLIIPDGADDSKPLFSIFSLVGAINKIKIEESKFGERSVSHITLPPVNLAWWNEGKHAVVTFGTSKPEELVKRMTGAGKRLPENALFKKVTSFKGYETTIRAFVDVTALSKAVRARGGDFGKVIDELGLDGLTSMVAYSGFEGAADRSLIEWHMKEGPRKGIFRLIAGKPFQLSDLPPVAPDVVSFSATNIDLAAAYDVAVPVAETIVGMINPGDRPKIKEFLKQADTVLGIDLRNDLLGSLGNRLLHYGSPAEGPFNLGETFVFQVKDSKKLLASLDQAIKGIATATGANIRVQKKKYHSVDVREVHVRQQGFFFLPTYAVHKDWLIISYFPQAVHGYILRAEGKLPAWKPSAHVLATLEKMPKEYVSLTISDPRPTVKQILSLAPLVVGLINSLVPDFKVDVAAMPNAHEATKHLFPNVSVVSEDGNVLRFETRASLALPFDLNGADSYGLFFLFIFAAQAA